MQESRASRRLVAIKVLHTVVWAFFASCVVLIPVAALIGRLDVAAVLCALVSVEVIVLAVNAWRCPLTGVAARYTPERQPNFDIYLPVWLARYNKEIFGPLFVAGLLTTGVVWLRQDAPPAFVYEERLGLARWRDDRGCLAVFNPSVTPLTRVALVEQPALTDVPRIRDGRIVGPSPACDQGLAGFSSRGVSPSFYQVSTTDSTAPLSGILLAVIDPPGPFSIRENRVEIDLNDDGEMESFWVCTSAENVHFMAWTGAPAQGQPRWHGRYYVAYDMVPTCTDQDIAGMVALEKRGSSGR